jgi:hypothetical protein
MRISNAGQKTFNEVIGPNEHKEKVENKKALDLQTKLEAHKAEQKTAWYKIKKFWKTN